MSSNDHLEVAFKRVGTPFVVYSAPVWRPRVGIAALVLIGVFSILGALFGERAPGVEEHLGVLIIGLGSLGLAAGILVHHLRSRHLRVLVCHRGLIVDQGFHFDCYSWADIVRVHEQKQGDSIHTLPVGVYRAALIEFADGKSLFLNRNRVQRVGQLIDQIQEAMWSRRSQDELGLKDERLARVAAAWPNLSRNEQSQILMIIDGAGLNVPGKR